MVNPVLYRLGPSSSCPAVRVGVPTTGRKCIIYSARLRDTSKVICRLRAARVASTASHSPDHLSSSSRTSRHPCTSPHSIHQVSTRVVHGSILCDPIQPNPLQLEKIGPNPTQPNTTNNRAYSLLVTYFYTPNLSVFGTCQIGLKIKFNCLVKLNLIQPCFKCINVVLSNF